MIQDEEGDVVKVGTRQSAFTARRHLGMEHCPGAGGSHYQLVPKTGRKVQSVQLVQISYIFRYLDKRLRNNYAYSFMQFASIYLAHTPDAIYPTANADINTATNGESSSNYSMVVLAPGLDPRRPSLHRRPLTLRRPDAGLGIISARAPLHECKSKVFWQV